MEADHPPNEPSQMAQLAKRVSTFVVESVDFPGNMFIEVIHLSGKVIIRINTRHRFYRELWEPLCD